MDILNSFLSLFFITSILGWLLELVYRRIFTAKRWINPGFLNGPWLPIYGIGIGVFYLLKSIDYKSFLSFLDNQIIYDIVVILLISMSFTIVEFIVGIFFTKVLKIRLWDYCDRFLNVKGIICPLYSFFWLCITILLYYFASDIIFAIALYAKGNHFIFFLNGVLSGCMLVDLSLTLELSQKIRRFAYERKRIVSYERLKSSIQGHLKFFKIKRNFIFPFVSPLALKDHMVAYFEEEDLKNKNKKKYHKKEDNT